MESSKPQEDAVAVDSDGSYKQFVAVKRGRYVQECIFLSLERAKNHIQDKSIAQYGIFGTLEEAVKYLVSSQPTTIPEEHAESGAQTEVAHDATVENQNASGESAADTTSNTITLPLIHPLPEQLPKIVEANTRKRKSHDIEASDGKTNITTRKRKPTKKWYDVYAKIREMTEKQGKATHELEDAFIKQWLKDQDDEYAKYLDGKPSTMFEEKIRLLHEIGFVFRRHREAQTLKMKNGENQNSQGRKVYKNWQRSLEKLKAYMDQNNGSWDVPRSEDANLREWVLEQRLELQKMVDGKPTSMTQEKLQCLREMGVDMKVTSWKERMDQLRAYKAEHGHLKIPMKDPTLGRWAQAIRRQAQIFVNTGKDTKDIDEGRLSQLKDIGFDTAARNDEEDKKKEEWNAEFEVMFPKLKSYKKEHGDCKVTRSKEKWRDLHNWVVRVRIEYNKLSHHDPLARLTAFQLHKLTEIGFAFRQKGSYKTWEQRIEDLKHYKEAHGNINLIPISHPELGEFVGRQRKQYREYCDGQKTTMTEERIHILEKLGFEWNVENWQDRSQIKLPKKTWEERYQELIAFQKRTGHTIVPQNLPGLGQWVHTQRQQLKAFQAGQKSSLNIEKAMKLTSIGFVVDVHQLRKRQKLDENSERDYFV